MDYNPYQAPSASINPEAGDGDGTDGAPSLERDLRIFVRRNPDYYLRKWAPALRGSGAAGFNLAALLFTGLWLPYRKMYRITFIFYGLFLLETIVELTLAGLAPGLELVVGLVGRVAGLAATIYVGTRGNAWYLAHAREAIVEVGALGLPDEQYTEELARRGGTNLPAAFGIFLLFVVLAMAVGAVAAVLTGEA